MNKEQLDKEIQRKLSVQNSWKNDYIKTCKNINMLMNSKKQLYLMICDISKEINSLKKELNECVDRR